MITVEFLNSLYNVLWYFGLTVMNTGSSPELQGHKPPTPHSDVPSNNTSHCGNRAAKVKLTSHRYLPSQHIIDEDFEFLCTKINKSIN